MEDNMRWKLLDFDVSGKIHSLDQLVPYASGQGYLRNIVIETASRVVGVEGEVYMPVTVFGTDATGLYDSDIGREIKCTGRLHSRRYVDGLGHVRWALAINARAIILGPAKTDEPMNKDEDPTGIKAMAESMGPGDDEDLPF
jgi:hypothetical protein